MEGDYLDAAEACQYLGIKRAWLFRLAKRHGLRRYHRPVNGRKSLFKKSDLDKLREPRPS